MSIEEAKELNKVVENLSVEEFLEWIVKRHGAKKVVLASSLSIEDQALTYLLLQEEASARIFFLDTGRHFQETYDLLDTTMYKYGFHYEVFAPNQKELEEMVSTYGPNHFYYSLEGRKQCCKIRKVHSLERVLSTAEAWITGLRREHSQGRQDIQRVEWDEAHGIFKYNPIINWSEEEVWAYIKQYHIPYSNLYEKGFRSIGCQPCTRAVEAHEDIRSGRWWWEAEEHKECGLHKK